MTRIPPVLRALVIAPPTPNRLIGTGSAIIFIGLLLLLFPGITISTLGAAMIVTGAAVTLVGVLWGFGGVES
jgi:hypothetical protein